MPDYSKGKIYKIRPTCEYEEGDEYYGSTIRPLSERMSRHRLDKGNCRSRLLFDKYGVENCIIELVEEYPCNNREQLDKREGEYQQANKCVNKLIAGRTLAERRETNIEYYKEKDKLRYEANKEKYIETRKAYVEANKEKIKAYNKAYREAHKSK